MEVAVVDTIHSGGNGPIAGGGVAARLLANGFNTKIMRPVAMNPEKLKKMSAADYIRYNALTVDGILRKEEWAMFDQRVVQVARQRLFAVQDLINAGLVTPVANGLGTTMIQWETGSDMDPAEASMSANTPAQNDGIAFQLKQMPLPIIHKDFYIDIRQLEASRKFGQSLDVAQAGLCTRLVAEKTESILFNGLNIVVGGFGIQGLTTATGRHTGSLAAWENPATLGTTILSDVLAMMGALVADNMYGPYALYVPVNYYNRMQDDFKANSGLTIAQRLLAIEGIKSIRPIFSLTAKNVVMVQLSEDVVDLVDGMQPTTLQWSTQGGLRVNFKVMSIMIPRVKQTQTGQSGIAHYIGA